MHDLNEKVFYVFQFLGLDGSLVFLEHVFWVVSLNTLFILVFGEYTCTLESVYLH